MFESDLIRVAINNARSSPFALLSAWCHCVYCHHLGINHATLATKLNLTNIAHVYYHFLKFIFLIESDRFCLFQTGKLSLRGRCCLFDRGILCIWDDVVCLRWGCCIIWGPLLVSSYTSDWLNFLCVFS